VGVRTCDGGLQGPENLILQLADVFKGEGVRYVIVNLWDGDPPRVALHEEALRRGHESHLIATTWGMNPIIFPRLAALIRRIRPDVVHTHDVKAEFAGLLAARLLGIPLVGSYYGRLAMSSKLLKAADLARFPAFRLFDRVLANSEAQRAELLHWGVRDERVVVVPSFVDTHTLRPPTAGDVAAARARLGIAPTQPVLATVAKLALNKGHRDMLHALAAIRAVEPKVLYLVPGEDQLVWRGEGGLRGDLEREAAALGVADNVRFLGYFPDLQTILNATDILVSPSLREGMQVSLVEAMAAGLPIVATAVGGTPDAVAHGETGLLVPPAQPAALAGAVLELLANRDRMRAMGVAGRRRAEERLDTRVVAAQVLRLCADVVAARGNRRNAS
jgi:glycosyltransferase involved in cell wall biosynthesis